MTHRKKNGEQRRVVANLVSIELGALVSPLNYSLELTMQSQNVMSSWSPSPWNGVLD